MQNSTLFDKDNKPPHVLGFRVFPWLGGVPRNYSQLVLGPKQVQDVLSQQGLDPNFVEASVEGNLMDGFGEFVQESIDGFCKLDAC